MGKSALVNIWLARMARDRYREARRVYAWSFDQQGTADAIVSADEFIERALEWFGDPKPAEGSPWDARHIRSHHPSSSASLRPPAGAKASTSN